MEYKLPKTENEILALIGPVSVPESLEYLRFHVVRYTYLLKIIDKILSGQIKRDNQHSNKTNEGSVTKKTTSNFGNVHESFKILDIGTGFEVQLIRDVFKTFVDTAGFYHSGWTELENEKFYELDLNELDSLSSIITEKYSLIVLAEVIEHIYTAPELVLDNIKNWLEPNGVLIIQTPNAVSLPKRLKMFLGIHPFEKIRLNKNNPGHFREYTLPELNQIIKNCGFEVLFTSRKNYFRPSNKLLSFLYSLEFLWPPSLRTGITLVVRNIV